MALAAVFEGKMTLIVSGEAETSQKIVRAALTVLNASLMSAQRNDNGESVWFSLSVAGVSVDGSTDDGEGLTDDGGGSTDVGEGSTDVGEGLTMVTLASLVRVALRFADGCSMLLLSVICDCCANTRAMPLRKAQSSSTIGARTSARTSWRASHDSLKLTVWEQTGVGRNGRASARSNVCVPGDGRRFCRSGNVGGKTGLCGASRN